MASSWPNVCNWAVFTTLIAMIIETNRGFISAQKSDSTACSAVKYAYETIGFRGQDVPGNTISGEHLSICPQGFTCCTQDMENKLNTKAKEDFNKVMADKVGLLRTTFISRTAKFDTFFTELLDNSKQDLHNMFVRTYGLLYQQNAYIFSELFEDLRSYYKGKDINLLDVLDNFFTRLLEKMFVLLHSSYKFNQEYLECITDQMGELKPFKDVPQKLSIQVKRAFIAARTFVQGLAVGRDVVLAVSKIEPSSSCHNALMKMMYCSYCRGLPYAKPCNNYCMNVMKGCLAFHAELNNDWNIYIDALLKLTERLESPFNIEAVVDPIDVKISDAIMNFQESADTITSKVFQGCGRPPPASNPDQRKRREAAAASSYDEYAGWKYEKKEYVRPTTAAGTSLDRLVRDIKEKVDTAKDFFKHLPNTVCNEKAAKIFDEGSCWNGLGVNTYMPEVMKDGLVAQLNNPEVDVDVRKPSAVINQQIIQLKVVTNKLRNAYNGVDVDWIDTADVPEYSSGSGSGSGSGYQGYDRSNNGISFSDPTHIPPRIQTYPPYKSNNKPQPNDDFKDVSLSSNTHAGLLILLLPILILFYNVHR